MQTEYVYCVVRKEYLRLIRVTFSFWRVNHCESCHRKSRCLDKLRNDDGLLDMNMPQLLPQSVSVTVQYTRVYNWCSVLIQSIFYRGKGEGGGALQYVIVIYSVYTGNYLINLPISL